MAYVHIPLNPTIPRCPSTQLAGHILSTVFYEPRCRPHCATYPDSRLLLHRMKNTLQSLLHDMTLHVSTWHGSRQESLPLTI